jgi:hypothetical protein
MRAGGESPCGKVGLALSLISLLVWLLVFLSFDARPESTAAGGEGGRRGGGETRSLLPAGVSLAGLPQPGGTTGPVGEAISGGARGGSSRPPERPRLGTEERPPLTATPLLTDWALTMMSPGASAEAPTGTVVGVELPTWASDETAAAYDPPTPCLLAPGDAPTLAAIPPGDALAAPLPSAAWGGVVLMGAFAARRLRIRHPRRPR